MSCSSAVPTRRRVRSYFQIAAPARRFSLGVTLHGEAKAVSSDRSPKRFAHSWHVSYMEMDKRVMHAQVPCLQHKRIVITRPIYQARLWAHKLAQLGAQPVLYPVIAIAPPQDTRPLRQALWHLAEKEFDWLVFSSANAVIAVRRMLADMECELPAGVKIAAVGQATAAAVEREWGRQVDFMAIEPNGACLGQTLPLQPNDSVLLPQALQARPHLAQILADRGGVLRVVTAYHTVPHCPKRDLREVLRHPGVDCVCFASPSSVSAFVVLLALHAGVELLSGVEIACLGDITAQAAQQKGLSVQIRCRDARFSTLLQALQKWYG